ncbi:ABC transporter ATP-binding protein [Kitasatospora misakiensis]|uniref:ABC transporter ATP-binding protein n=1 Tax=Kitasatospora misakiensis TaxID=67330 RepID=A0ABW0X832_9ACTN
MTLQRSFTKPNPLGPLQDGKRGPRAAHATAPATATEPLLAVRDLAVTLADGRRTLPAVRGVSFELAPGEALALVGESGAGKSLTALALLGLAPASARVTGSARLGGDELVGAPRALYRRLWGRRIALVPQDALAVLSPVHTVGDQLAFAVRSVRRAGRREAERLAAAALEQVGIPAARARAYPHEFSGGMRQRAAIAMAMVNRPELVVADEPTTALDPRAQAQVLGTLAELRESTGAALLLVTHDLGIVAAHADRVAVLYAGRLAESGPAGQVLADPRSPYTAGLLAALPPDRATDRRLHSIGGAPPAPDRLPPGCAFAPRCPLATDRCRTEEPRAGRPAPGRTLACHHRHRLPADLFTAPAAA